MALSSALDAGAMAEDDAAAAIELATALVAAIELAAASLAALETRTGPLAAEAGGSTGGFVRIVAAIGIKGRLKASANRL